jgi:hypothetical protein
MAEKKSTLTDWVLFVVSTALMVYLLMFHSEWFWAMMPFVGLFGVRALRVI